MQSPSKIFKLALLHTLTKGEIGPMSHVSLQPPRDQWDEKSPIGLALELQACYAHWIDDAGENANRARRKEIAQALFAGGLFLKVFVAVFAHVALEEFIAFRISRSRAAGL
ncbi:MAG: hypothetical protein JNM86_08005 [Phycisphaerae bacterium]|nr:hypothetical protein [Phycisphaerae bacterium]